MTISTPGTREYCRTFSASTKHVVNPDKPGKTLCGAGVAMLCAGTLPHNRNEFYGLPTCAKCEAGATKRGLAEGPEIYRAYQPRVISYVKCFQNVACIANVDMVTEETGRTFSLCGTGANISTRLDNPQGQPVCPGCQARADEDGYYHPGAEPVQEAAAPAQPAVITWAFSRSNFGCRHVVDDQAVIPEAEAGQRTLCGVSAWHTRPSTKLAPASMWDRAVACRPCEAKAKTRGMITQEQADQAATAPGNGR